jgi:large subunit ribosomal protein L17
MRGWQLGRTAEHRRALLKNLAASLFRHGQITTTLPKAKALRPFAERLITLARQKTLHHYRQAIARLGDPAVVEVLFRDIGPHFAGRPGGYTRIVRLPRPRLGDAGATAMIALVDYEASDAARGLPPTEGEAPAAKAVEAKQKQQTATA